ncbi:YgiQ family radical SAM protein [Duganella sp. FT135W]|uniref:YgiQ family radical SAM protein n=2 Tax=Duganella flavida TaxID=2692175 RepID=A0A6L8KGN9_9BURK|nr:YgiQ family radical SAM protein [Duganella flavida]
MNPPTNLFAAVPKRSARAAVAPFLPMSRQEMDVLGWDECDVILVTGDAYIDHPSFGMALVGRLLEANGYRVGIIAQPDWQSADAFRTLGKPRLYYGVTAGNMDSMVNRYTADRKPRSDDAYTPNGEPNKRPDRAVSVYAQRCREAFPGTPVVIGSIEASLRRIAHYDYWSDKVRRSVLFESKADMLIFGNAERALVDLTKRMADGESIKSIRDLRGTSFLVPAGWMPGEDWGVHNSTRVDTPGKIDKHIDPYLMVDQNSPTCATDNKPAEEVNPAMVEPTKEVAPPPPPVEVVKTIRIMSREERRAMELEKHHKTVVRLPSFETVTNDPVMYAHASRVFHLESNPGNARALVQGHGDRDVWMNPPPLPLQMDEMDNVYDMNYARGPHPSYGGANIPAWEMIRFSVNIMRGCFGGCTFCSITEHEGRIIQSRSEPSILREIEHIRDKTKGFTGIISDLGGPTANMYRLSCKDKEIETTCRRLSCVYPSICVNLGTNHNPLIKLYRRAREIPGIKKILIQSGLRYDLAVRSPEYVKELVTHHVGGLLKIAPEHTESNVLSKMMKPGIGAYDEFKALFEKYSLEAGKKQYLIPYFIAAHPGATDEDMLNLALWLKKNNFRLDQVQTFMPTPMAMASAMYHSRRNPLHKVTDDSEEVFTPRTLKQRQAHKAFLRYYDPKNWPILRDALRNMGRGDLIGTGERHLIPPYTAGEENFKASQGKRAMPMLAPGAGKRGPGAPMAGARGKPNALTGSLTARQTVETKGKPSILDTIKVKKAAPAPAKGGNPGRTAAASGGRGRK